MTYDRDFETPCDCGEMMPSPDHRRWGKCEECRRTRVVNIRNEPCDVYVGRPSIWGNPFSHLNGKGTMKVTDRAQAVRVFEEWLLGTPASVFEQKRRAEILRRIPELRGKRLGCWCHPEECHAEILAKMADADFSPTRS